MEDSNSRADAGAAAGSSPVPPRSDDDGRSGRRRRRPFTSLSQVEADRAIARLLQEQERAYMQIQRGEVRDDYEDDYEDEDEGSGNYQGEDEDDDYVEGEVDDEEDDADQDEGSNYEEDVIDDNADVDLGLDPANFPDNESYARAVMEAEERIMYLPSATDGQEMDYEEIEDEQDDSEDIDPDDYSYEELIALGEAVGTESRGLSTIAIASLPSVTYKSNDCDGNREQCVVCRMEFDDGESLLMLPCKHIYHSECINQWLQFNKTCPMCSTEVSTAMASDPKTMETDPKTTP